MCFNAPCNNILEICLFFHVFRLLCCSPIFVTFYSALLRNNAQNFARFREILRSIAKLCVFVAQYDVRNIAQLRNIPIPRNISQNFARSRSAQFCRQLIYKACQHHHMCKCTLKTRILCRQCHRDGAQCASVSPVSRVSARSLAPQVLQFTVSIVVRSLAAVFVNRNHHDLICARL